MSESSSKPIRIPIDIGATPTSLVVERGGAARIAQTLADAGIPVADRRVLLVIDRNVSAVAGRIATSLAGAHAHVAVIHLDATEAQKSMRAVDDIWHAALSARIDRGGLFIAVGGGLLGDLAGFAAATFLRGVDLVQVPTTLLAMVDSSIGGKTGINLALPAAVWARILRVRFGSLGSPSPTPICWKPFRRANCAPGSLSASNTRLLWANRCFPTSTPMPSLLALGDPSAIDRLIPSSAAVKAEIVTRDPFERSERAKLNLGHTFGHAIETVRGLDLLHGEAVAIGLHAACTCAVSRGILPSATADRIVRLIERCGLPIRLPTPVAVADIEHRMGFDKKNQGESCGWFFRARSAMSRSSKTNILKVCTSRSPPSPPAVSDWRVLQNSGISARQTDNTTHARCCHRQSEGRLWQDHHRNQSRCSDGARWRAFAARRYGSAVALRCGPRRSRSAHRAHHWRCDAGGESRRAVRR